MKPTPLLPHHYKRWGWILLIPSALLGIFLTIWNDAFIEWHVSVFAFVNEDFLKDAQYFKVIETNLVPTIIGAIFIIGGLLVAFSREKVEDEYIRNLRLGSFQWAVLINYLLLLFCFLFIYGLSFLTVMTYNMFTVLLLFIIRFHYLLYVNLKSAADEK